MRELVYDNGRYYEVTSTSRKRRRDHGRVDVWRMTSEWWDQVLYNIGDVYYKVRKP
ncbi:hypothetical protein PT974_04439 [Cladobotryum mycophilum]|uniref:Uncharacterized protein n=1 Tax=Cladobotryum mycophilum TaxID=491253 RepID=A0ABR0SW55_9HYPO